MNSDVADRGAKTWYLKVSAIAGGYVLSFVLAWGAVALRVAATSGQDRQSAGGMYAFGDSLFFAGVFCVAAMVPTGFALFLLRAFDRFWKVLSTLALFAAGTGIIAVIIFFLGRRSQIVVLKAMTGVSVLRILATPLMALAFVVCAISSPNRFVRKSFVASMAVEIGVFFAWLVPMFLLWD